MFKTIASMDDYLKVVAVRSIVFIHEQNCPYEEELDGLDLRAQHILGEKKSEPFACGRIRYIDDFAKLERIAIRKEWRKSGLGKSLVNFMVKEAENAGFKIFKMNAQVNAIPFYEKLGFTPYGEVFTEAGILHRKMIKRI